MENSVMERHPARTKELRVIDFLSRKALCAEEAWLTHVDSSWEERLRRELRGVNALRVSVGLPELFIEPLLGEDPDGVLLAEFEDFRREFGT